MKNLKYNLIGAALLALFVVPSSTALASMPSLSVYAEGNNSVRVNITGADRYAPITLYQRSGDTSLWSSTYNFGQTDSWGSFNGLVNTGYGYAQYSEFYVVVNGQQSTIQRVNNNFNYSGCSYYYNNYCNNNNNTGLRLSETSVTINSGQTKTITIYNDTNYNNGYYYNQSYYVSYNSNSNAVNATIDGSSVRLYGASNGSGTVTVCQNTDNRCATVTVTVYGNNYYNYNNNNNYNSYYPATSCNPNAGVLYPYGYNNCNQYPSYQPTPYVLGSSTYRNGSLISENGTVYLVYKNTKTAFANKWAFEGLGYRFANVVAGYNANLNPSGYTVSSANQRHPWGSWIKSGNTVYFVHESGLIPVSNYDVFLSNGGQDNFVVLANFYDFQIPILSNLEYGDYRLR